MVAPDEMQPMPLDKEFIPLTGIVADMLNKILNVRKLAPFTSHGRPRPVAQIQQGPRESRGMSSALKIVHPARPEVFRRRWDSLVRSHEILSPGEKFYVVPRHTIRKLRRRIKKPSGDVSVSQFFTDVSKGIDVKHNTGLAAIKTSKNEGIVAIADDSKKQSQQVEKRKSKNGVLWQPRLEAISESPLVNDVGL
ncbi:hypothetical protein F3Y22_tig00110462pilonHSYRG00386 [Hibiscus syriacus]|uniref:Uncharacterized protein n=1 Tax=Hibiscus syriacus TaxID=106335 RepID=A0A6A3AH96_HIBSY|nr:hypothetical protein F3Y22_tig00110462pilonHSYRG00386 [Hibiscus syriacus]